MKQWKISELHYKQADAMTFALDWTTITAACIAADTARTCCRNKGEGWSLQPFSLWGAIALWCKKNATMPHGNNAYGRDNTYTHEKGVQAMSSEGVTTMVATGSGPATWYHDHTSAGIADMNGNVSEWCDGMRLVNGEIQIIPYANCMLAASDLSSASTEWKAIKADGSLVTPGTSGTLKYDYVNSEITLSTIITNQEDASHSHTFQTLQTASGITVPQILKELALFPADADGHEADHFYMNNGAEETFPLRGGHWSSGTNAGVFYTTLSAPRLHSNTNAGFRSAYYGEF